ncbi:hypothetical protein ACFFP0_31650 [Rhizobium puerariae]|uniref:Terminase small subunit n=1 Tax=Rhizobium puerariae TaxID=1585791 RepID=A0ABV6AS27_9HYPH
MSEALIETKAAFARRLNVSPGYVSNLVKQGLPVAPDGQVPVDLALAWIRKNIRSGPGRPVGSVEGGGGGGDAADLTAARTRLIIAKAEKAEMALQVQRGELMPRAEASAAIRSTMRYFRDQALLIPARYGADIAAEAEADFPRLAAAMETHLRKALHEIVVSGKSNLAAARELSKLPSILDEEEN